MDLSRNNKNNPLIYEELRQGSCPPKFSSSNASFRCSFNDDMIFLDTEQQERCDDASSIINKNHVTLSTKMNDLLMTKHINDLNGVPLSVDLNLRESLFSTQMNFISNNKNNN